MGESEWIYADTEDQRELVLFWEHRKTELQGEADWIKERLGDSFDAASNKLIFLSIWLWLNRQLRGEIVNTYFKARAKTAA